MQIVTPLSQSKTAAMIRVQDLASRGYTRYINGTVALEKLPKLVRKLHMKYSIAATPAQRMTRKSKGFANAILVLYFRHGDATVQWMLLATSGAGMESESMQDVSIKRLHWLGYEFVRHATRGRVVWTWRRPKVAQTEFYAALDEYLGKKYSNAVEKLLQLAANQPGFHGVREQNKLLFAHAVSRGYTGPLPILFYVQKVKHGEPFRIEFDGKSTVHSN